MLLFLDFETYHDREYSLKKMTPAEYILDPPIMELDANGKSYIRESRFEVICLGVAQNDAEADIVDGPDIAAYLGTVDSKTATTVTYNALFDNSILAWRYNFVPGRMVDGLGMARALLGSRLRSLSLESVAEYLGLGEKGKAIHEVMGMHREDIQRDPDLWDRFRAYCLKDTALLREIFTELSREFPTGEYAVMDAVLRTCIEPAFHCDVALLREHLTKIRTEKDRLVGLVGANKETISGNKSFISLLQNAGVEVETKPGKKGPIPALAKTDAFMQRLLEDERPEVQCLAAARLGVKSTLEERRSERLISIASLPWPNSSTLMPIPLRYSGAHTWRLSGDWKINMQNLPSARTGDPVLRKALCAPLGQKVVVGDLAQIEARLVAWFCGAEGLLIEFREKRDPYSRLAEQIFDVPVSKETMSGVARHIGKAGILGCGYGMGPDKFYESVLRQARATLKPEQAEILRNVWSTDLARKSVYAYRERYYQVRQMWGQLESALSSPWLGKTSAADRHIGPICISNRGGCGVVAGPGGREIRYPNPMCDENGQHWWFSGGVPFKIYGAALLENIIQFLARVVMFDIAMRLKVEGLRFVHQVHDELVFIVPDWHVGMAEFKVKREMTVPPEWCHDLPLDCDIGHGQCYGDCK